MRNPDEAPAAASCSGPASREMLHGMLLVPMTRTAVLPRHLQWAAMFVCPY